jgi:hypothetical protein
VEHIEPFPDIQIRLLHSPHQVLLDCKYPAELENRSWADWKVESRRAEAAGIRCGQISTR